MFALLLVDLQNDFLPGGALAVPDGDAVLPVAADLIPRFDLVVATQDWHPPDHLSFASQHDRPVGTMITLDDLPQVLWPDHCVQDTPGAALAEGIDPARIAATFRKGCDRRIDSYSGFHDNGHRRSTGLAEWLRERGVRGVFVMGLATDYCVQFTALDALREGFETWLVTDGCRAVDLRAGDGQRAIDALRAAGVQCLDSRSARDVARQNRADRDEVGRYDQEILAHHQYLQLVRRGHWEFARRHNASGAVALVAVTDERRLILVEQFRLPHGRRVIELPAGIVGDEPRAVPELPGEAAARELLEETGYRARTVRYLTHGPTSAGFSDEAVMLFAASGLERISAGGGIGREQITVHEVPLDEACGWLGARIAGGALVDPKVFAGVYFAAGPAKG